MPIARNYKQGSIIYFEGDKNASEIFILQKGKVILSSTSLDTGEEVKETIANGEFFGVKSVLGKYPREDTAQVTSSAIVLVLKPGEFETMVLGNFRILMKMLKVFSNQLRRIGKTVRDLMHKGEPKLPATELYYIGEYYFKKGKVDQAKYVYEKYIEFYPGEQFVPTAKERLQSIASGNVPSPEDISAGGAVADAPVAPPPPIPSPDAPIEDMFSDPAAPPPAEPEKPDILKGTEGIDITKKFYEALSLFSQDKFEEAIGLHKSIAIQTQFKDDETAKFVEKAMFEMGKCYTQLDKHMEAIEAYSNLIKKFSLTEFLKEALFNIGGAYEKMEKFDKAINFYQKVVNTPPKQEINKTAKDKLEELQKKM